MKRIRKYNTEEERKAARRESQRKYYQNNKEKILERHADYYQNNKEKIAEYYQNNKEKITERKIEYYQNNKEKILEQIAAYRLTPFGRASNLVGTYKQNDERYNRGECTLTPEWIVEHIFNEPCHYCGKPDWHELGCDRIDNSLPHTPDNVVPCCWECNIKKQKTPYDEYMRLIGKIA